MKLWLFWEWQPWQEKIVACISSYRQCNYSNSQAPWQIFDLKDNLRQTNTLEDGFIEARPKTVPMNSRCLIIQENQVEGFTNPSSWHWVLNKGNESSWKCLWYMAWDNVNSTYKLCFWNSLPTSNFCREHSIFSQPARGSQPWLSSLPRVSDLDLLSSLTPITCLRASLLTCASDSGFETVTI